jgi:hypothetical protein
MRTLVFGDSYADLKACSEGLEQALIDLVEFRAQLLQPVGACCWLSSGYPIGNHLLTPSDAEMMRRWGRRSDLRDTSQCQSADLMQISVT